MYLALLTILAFLCTLAGCDRLSSTSQPAGPSSSASPPAAPPVPVSVATIAAERVPLTLRAIGVVEAYQMVTVRPRVEGQLTQIHFSEGQDVHAGDPLFTIDPRTYQAALRLAEAQLIKNRAMFTDATRAAEHVADLHAHGSAADRERDSSKAQADAWDAQVKADEAGVERARLEMEFCSIRSPLDGRVGAKLADVGNVVKANETPLVVINQLQPVYVSFSVAEQHLATVAEHMRANPLAAEARIPLRDEAPETGQLRFIDNQVDRSTGMIRLKAVFENSARRLWPGLFVNVTLILAERPKAIVAPAQAIQTGQQGTFVYVVRGDETVELRPVKVADTSAGRTVVQEGLRPGEVVVTDGQLRLTPGAKIERKPDVTAPRGGPS